MEVFELLLKYLTWPAVTLAAFWLLRRSIYRMIGNVTHVKADQKGFEATLTLPKDDVPRLDEMTPPPSVEQESKLTKPEQSLPGPTDEEGWRNEMIHTALGKNGKGFERAFDRLGTIVRDDIQRKRDKILYLKLSHYIGKTNAIQNLQGFLFDDEVSCEANKAIGDCYYFSNDFPKAVEYFREATRLARDEKIRVDSFSRLAEALYNSGNKSEAIDSIVIGLSAVVDPDNKASLYLTAAEIYKKSNDNENYALALDKALEQRPNNSDLLFKAAYAYADAGINELSFLHYKSALWISSDESGILNNLGVQCNRLAMPAKGVAYYERAEEIGNTLASSNLANLLTDAGFLKLAMDKLNKAKQAENVNPNVFESISRVSNLSDNEEETEKATEQMAYDLRVYFLEFTSQKYSIGDSLSTIAGKWKTENGTVFTFEIKDNVFIGEWDNYGGAIGDARCKISGKTGLNAAALFFVASNRHVPTSIMLSAFGHVYCSKQNDKLRILLNLRTKSPRWLFYTLSRSDGK